MNDKNNKNEIYEDTLYSLPRYIRKLCKNNLVFIDVYETIFQFWNKGKTCYLSNAALCKRSGASTRQVFEALAFFEKHGELKREKRGLKRFLIKPEMTINTNIDHLCAPPHDDTKDNQVCAPAQSPMRSTAHHPCAPPHIEYNEEIEYIDLKKEKEKEKENNIIPYQETYYPIPQDKKTTLQKKEIIENNPHDIPFSMIEDWLINRKAKRSPLTKTAWIQLNEQLASCDNPIEAFKEMVARGWISLKAEWFKKKTSHFDNENTNWIKEINEDLF